MQNKIWEFLLSKFRKAFSSEETRFQILVGLKVTGISLFITGFIYYFLFQILRLNHAFFKAHGFPDFADDSPFFDYVFQEAVDNFPVLFVFHICLFFIGVYVGWIIMRPFRNLGEYCEKVLENPQEEYKVDEFSTYALFTRFSEFFFEYLRDARSKGELKSNSIPPAFAKIHKPVPDKVFILHFGLLLIIIAICSSVFIIDNASSVFNHMVDLAQKTLSNTKPLNKYFGEQMFVLDELVFLTISLTVIFYIALGLHIYNKVSGAAFGIFSTMRSFMKGNHSSRVHLVGYAHIREHTRKLNKYLDYIESKLIKSKSNS
jgi:hypothetical protein